MSVMDLGPVWPAATPPGQLAQAAAPHADTSSIASAGDSAGSGDATSHGAGGAWQDARAQARDERSGSGTSDRPRGASAESVVAARMEPADRVPMGPDRSRASETGGGTGIERLKQTLRDLQEAQNTAPALADRGTAAERGSGKLPV